MSDTVHYTVHFLKRKAAIKFTRRRFLHKQRKSLSKQQFTFKKQSHVLAAPLPSFRDITLHVISMGFRLLKLFLRPDFLSKHLFITAVEKMQ